MSVSEFTEHLKRDVVRGELAHNSIGAINVLFEKTVCWSCVRAIGLRGGSNVPDSESCLTGPERKAPITATIWWTRACHADPSRSIVPNEPHTTSHSQSNG